MTIVCAENPMVLLPKAPLDDARLSYKAIGLLAYLLSRPDGWKMDFADLVKSHTDGYDSVRSGLVELIDHGYAVRTRINDPATGKEADWEIVISDEPQK